MSKRRRRRRNRLYMGGRPGFRDDECPGREALLPGERPQL